MRTILLSIISLSLFSYCTPHYGVANFVSESSFTPKPSYRDTIAEAQYISGSLHQTVDNSAFQYGESITLGVVNFTQANTTKYGNTAISGFVHAGSYNANDYELLNGGNKSLFGLGITADANVTIPSKYVDWRIIGAKWSFAYENGSYAQFRKNGDNIGVLENMHPRNMTFNLSATSEIVIKGKQSDVGIWTSLGTGSQIVTIGSGMYYRSRRYTGFFQINGSFGGSMLGGGLIYQLK